MPTLSSAAWMVHDVGLATAIGGTLFGKEALEPALDQVIEDEPIRDNVSDTAWRRFSWINLAGHVAMAATWFVGRTMLSGREVSGTSRKLTVAKDVLVIASLATGVASIVLGRVLGQRVRATESRRASAGGGERPAQVEGLRKAVGIIGTANLIANLGVGAVTTALSMEGNKSLPFTVVSRKLP